MKINYKGLCNKSELSRIESANISNASISFNNTSVKIKEERISRFNPSNKKTDKKEETDFFSESNNKLFTTKSNLQIIENDQDLIRDQYF